MKRQCHKIEIIRLHWEIIYIEENIPPYPALLVSYLQDANKNDFFLRSQNSRNKGFSYYFCFMMGGSQSIPQTRVSFETSFDSKQPKLEPKLVSALSETKCLFRLFRFYTEPESFGVSIEPKQTEDQPKQFDREQILVFFHKILCCFGLFRNSLFRLFRILYWNSEFRCRIEENRFIFLHHWYNLSLYEYFICACHLQVFKK